MPFAIDSNTIRHEAAVVSFGDGETGVHLHELLEAIADFCLQNPTNVSIHDRCEGEIAAALARLSVYLCEPEKRDDDDNLDTLT